MSLLWKVMKVTNLQVLSRVVLTWTVTNMLRSLLISQQGHIGKLHILYGYGCDTYFQ